MSKNAPCLHVLIAAAGSGTRMQNSDIPKQYLSIQGKSVLRHTIEKFQKIEGLSTIRVIIAPEHETLYNDAVHGLKIEPPVFGCSARKRSVYNGLKSFSHVKQGDIVLIHDAARPLVHIDDIYKTIDAAIKDKAATLAYKMSDTLYSDTNHQTVDREHLWSIQTPQAFDYDLIMKAHETYKHDSTFTDDRGMVEALGQNVTLIEGSKENIKITTADDLIMAEKLLNTKKQTITALGFDVHAFEEGTSVRLGGIDIPHNKSLQGHSDADVVLHAITDAILGALNEGDIGTHFPPSDPQWKDADSALFLNETIKKLNNKNALLDFIDVTIMAEEPKIGPHRDAMQKRISEITGLHTNDISIKATTTEKLGFTGRGEGIACQCVATITRIKG
ncbi:MAG: bifunctional 2-C-methyl-D-erythritol 4-phosphate cytidylyltransferase/2-C-methyl-D-erythritol 2,4-cyclodiphosphate synthase [Micavibrio sp.]|nr:bifunctional 2-C-methyl-D-erythritol 4-phosphate cytidylyltransferase/2-C-methyl-D-erythritol 2,4-cyclodiphosphate synthase [Micavibrio sp.]